MRDVMVHIEPFDPERPQAALSHSIAEHSARRERRRTQKEKVSAFPPDYIRAHLLALGCDLARVEESFIHSGGHGGQNVNKGRDLCAVALCAAQTSC